MSLIAFLLLAGGRINRGPLRIVQLIEFRFCQCPIRCCTFAFNQNVTFWESKLGGEHAIALLIRLPHAFDRLPCLTCPRLVTILTGGQKGQLTLLLWRGGGSRVIKLLLFFGGPRTRRHDSWGNYWTEDTQLWLLTAPYQVIWSLLWLWFLFLLRLLSFFIGNVIRQAIAVRCCQANWRTTIQIKLANTGKSAPLSLKMPLNNWWQFSNWFPKQYYDYLLIRSGNVLWVPTFR